MHGLQVNLKTDPPSSRADRFIRRQSLSTQWKNKGENVGAMLS